MTESEFKRLRLLKQNFRKMLVRDGLEKRYSNILDEMQAMLDKYLYNDYKKTLANPTTYQKIKDSKQSKFIDYMLSFINEYEKKQ